MVNTLDIIIFKLVTQSTTHLHLNVQTILAQTFLSNEMREISSITITVLFCNTLKSFMLQFLYIPNIINFCRVWWCTPIITACRTLKQGDHCELKASPNYVEQEPISKKKKFLFCNFLEKGRCKTVSNYGAI